MGNRLSKIYTRTGDDGTTGLTDGSRVPKDDARVHAMGEVDELNSAIGLLLTETLPQDIEQTLIEVQHALFDLGGELSMPGHSVIDQLRVDALEQALDKQNETLPPLKEFILPGGTTAAAHCHLARSICRRAERRLHSLATEAEVNTHAIKFLNRLSDLLFVTARSLNKAAGSEDVLWRHDRTKRNKL